MRSPRLLVLSAVLGLVGSVAIANQYGGAGGRGVITSERIFDGTIVNADIKADAGIDPQKLSPGTVTATEFGLLNGHVSALLDSTGPEQIAGTLSVDGGLSAQTLVVNGLAQVKGALSVDGGISAQTLAVNGLTQVKGTLSVDGGISAQSVQINGALTATEQAAPALSSAGTAKLYSDSTAHTLKMSLNGGAYYDVLDANTGIAKTGGTLTGQLAFSGVTADIVASGTDEDLTLAGNGTGIVVATKEFEVRTTATGYATIVINQDVVSGAGYAAQLKMRNSANAQAVFDIPESGGGTNFSTHPSFLTISAPSGFGTWFTVNGTDNTGVKINTTGTTIYGPLDAQSTATFTGKVSITANSNVCTLDGASPSVCPPQTVTAAAKCWCTSVGTTAAIAAQGCAVSLSGTTLTITSANGATNAVNYGCDK